MFLNTPLVRGVIQQDQEQQARPDQGQGMNEEARLAYRDPPPHTRSSFQSVAPDTSSEAAKMADPKTEVQNEMSSQISQRFMKPVRMPHKFKGNNITDYLERFELYADAYGVCKSRPHESTSLKSSPWRT